MRHGVAQAAGREATGWTSASWPSAWRTSQRSWSPEYSRFSSTAALRSRSRRRSSPVSSRPVSTTTGSWRVSRALEQPLEHAEAVELRHREVEHEHVGRAHGDHRERLDAVRGLAQLAAVARERLDHEPAQRDVVVDDEHRGALGRELARNGLAQLIAG